MSGGGQGDVRLYGVWTDAGWVRFRTVEEAEALAKLPIDRGKRGRVTAFQVRYEQAKDWGLA